MNRRRFTAIAIAVTLFAASIWTLVRPAEAFLVFDPSNYGQNVLTAARALTQISNQIQSLQNQTIGLQNMALNLQHMDYSSLGTMTSAMQRIDTLMNQAQGITFDVNSTTATFQRLYPQQYAAAVTSDQLVLDARGRWTNSMDAYQQTLTVQAQVVGNVQEDSGLLSDLVTASQGSVGALQAQQATNQLLALSTKQQLQIQNMMAAQYRAEALEHARTVESQAQGKASFDQFVGSGSAYTPR
jgi:P-type conjugative transfer protein TrbJ